MSTSALTLDLAKLMIAAAWADGSLSNDEINAMKDLLFTLDEISSEEWKRLEMYMNEPVAGEELEALLTRVTS